MPHRIVNPLELPPISLSAPSCQWLVENNHAKISPRGLFANLTPGPRIAEVPAELRKLGLGATTIGLADASAGFYLQALPVVSEPQRRLDLTWTAKGVATTKSYFVRDGFVAHGAPAGATVQISPGFSASLLCSILTREFASPKPWNFKIESLHLPALRALIFPESVIGSPQPAVPEEVLAELKRNRFVIQFGGRQQFSPGAQKLLEPIFALASLAAKVTIFADIPQERELMLVGVSGKRLWLEEQPLPDSENKRLFYRALSLPQAAEMAGFMVGL